jgi:hypothetical protein
MYFRRCVDLLLTVACVPQATSAMNYRCTMSSASPLNTPLITPPLQDFVERLVVRHMTHPCLNTQYDPAAPLPAAPLPTV